MYQVVDNTLVLSVNDWCKAGLSYNQFRLDSQRGYLDIYQRGINGNTLIDVGSIKRPDRIAVLEEAYGKIEDTKSSSIFYVELDTEARKFFTSYLKPDGTKLKPKQALKYIHRASIFEGVKRGLQAQQAARARAGRRIKMGEFWKLATQWLERCWRSIQRMR